MNTATDPKYKQIKEYIIRFINVGELKAGDKINSEQAWMDQFNVSRHTVRKAIDDLVGEGLLYKQQGRGTFVSDPFANDQSQGKLVGVITTYLNDYIFPEIIHGIEKVLTENGYSILLGNTNNKIEKERTVLTNMLLNNLNGLIVEPTKSVFPNHNKDLFQKLIDRGVPILYIHAAYQNISGSYLIEDDHKAGYIATQHLVDLGHKCIGGIFKNDDLQGHGRYSGMVECLRNNDLKIVEESIVWFGTEDKSLLFDSTNAIQLLERFRSCSAIVCYNDQIAMDLIGIAKKQNREIPKEFSLVSFDNSSLAQNGEVKLTSIAHPKGVFGEKAANMMLQLMKNKGVNLYEVITPELIIRESSKPNID